LGRFGRRKLVADFFKVGFRFMGCGSKAALAAR
jgi:hypothetical protein